MKESLLQFAMPILGIIFMGWVSALAPFTHRKKNSILWSITIIAGIISYLLNSFHDWYHFISHETIPSIAMVLGICGVLAYNFAIIPSNKLALFLLAGFAIPIISNTATSLMVLPLLIGITPYVFKTYGKLVGLLFLLLIGMMCANTLAVFTVQADLPTSAYASDLVKNAEYTQGKSPLPEMRRLGSIAFIFYVIILFFLIRPRVSWFEIKKIRFGIENKYNLFISIGLCLFFIFALKTNIWQVYLIAPLIAFTCAFILQEKAFLEHSKSIREKILENSANNIAELKNIYMETIVLFSGIFFLIQCMPLNQIHDDPHMIVLATIIETLFSDNLIAFQANKIIGYSISWEFGTQWVLLSSILYGAHFPMGHVVSIFFFLGFLPKIWDKKFINVEESSLPQLERFNEENISYNKILIPKFMMVSLALLPLTVGFQLSFENGYLLIIAGGVITTILMIFLKRFFLK